MPNLDFNKIFMAVFSVALFLLGAKEVSGIVYGTAGHHGHHDDHAYESKTKWAQSNFPGYWVDIVEESSAASVVEAIFDWGLALRNADLAKGERVFKSACSSCHTIAQGGANGTGPNLYNIVGAELANVSGFGYSAALTAIGGQWDYEKLNAWLYNPSKFARGTSMSYRGIRKDQDRANLVAYLASETVNAPEFPEPLPQAEAEIIEIVDEITDSQNESLQSSMGEESLAPNGEDANQQTENALEETISPT